MKFNVSTAFVWYIVNHFLTRRFYKHIRFARPDECWEWTSSKASGYGRFSCLGVNWIAPRFAYFIEHGELPDDVYVCHKCDNPGCVNPRHLWLGSAVENIQDCVRKGRNNHPGGRSIYKAWHPDIYM